MVATIGAIEIAGSKVKFDNTLQGTEEELAGLSGSTRFTRYSCDARARLFGSVTAVSSMTTPPAPAAPGVAVGAAPGVAQDLMSPADFRKGQERTPLLDPATRNDLKNKGIDPNKIDPPGSTAQSRPGHKIDKFTKNTTTADFKWTRPDGTGNGDVRTEDGRFRYSYDEKHHLIWVAEKPVSTASPIRRVLYSYDANDRLIGRTAQYASLPTLSTPFDTLLWQTEDRASIIAADGVPPELTFVWDAVTDRLLSIFKTGNSASASDPNGNLLRQFIHGDLGLDDPIEITAPDLVAVIPPGGAPPVARIYPVYDEAGNGTLQVVVNRNGEVVSRHIATDPYGAEEFELAGATIDQVEVKAKKNATGALESVRIRMRATEALRETSIAPGSRLAVVKPNGSTAALSPVDATSVAADPFRLEWNLTAAQWNTLISDGTSAGGTSLSIAATNQLRAGAWAVDVPILPAPAWATATLPVFSSPTLPVEVRDSLSTITSFITAIPASSEATATPYEVTGLGSLGTNGGNGDADLLMAAGFHAQPFSDPFSGKNYVRARWLDPETGTWLTPDPLSYRDSSNLYAFAAGDPINGRDPEGLKVAVYGPKKNKDAAMARLKRVVDNPEAMKHVEVDRFGVLQFKDITPEEFIKKYDGRARQLGQMMMSERTLLVTEVNDDDKVRSPMSGRLVSDDADDAGGGFVSPAYQDGKHYFSAFNVDSFPADYADVTETPDTVFVHEFFGHGFARLVPWYAGGYTEKETGHIKPEYIEDPPLKGGYHLGEEEGLTAENRYRIDHGMPIRTYYLNHPGEWVYPDWIKPFIEKQRKHEEWLKLQEHLRSEERRRKMLEHNIWHAPGLR